MATELKVGNQLPKSSWIEPMMSTSEAAAIINLEPRTLDQWRYTGKHRLALPHFKLGRTVRYRREDVLAFIAAGQIGGVQST